MVYESRKRVPAAADALLSWAYFNVDKSVAFFCKDGPHVIFLRVLDVLRKSAPRQAQSCQESNESGYVCGNRRANERWQATLNQRQDKPIVLESITAPFAMLHAIYEKPSYTCCPFSLVELGVTGDRTPF